MTEDTSATSLYVYVKDWERHQPRADRPGLPWIRVETMFLGNDAWLDLSCPDTKLLMCIWLLAQRYGNGRVKADERWLKSQAKAHKSSLDRLVQAGFLTLSTTKAPRNGGLEEKRGEEEKPSKVSPSSTASREDSSAGVEAPPPNPHRNGQLRKPSPTELDDDLRPLREDDDYQPLRDSRGFLY